MFLYNFIFINSILYIKFRIPKQIVQYLSSYTITKTCCLRTSSSRTTQIGNTTPNLIQIFTNKLLTNLSNTQLIKSNIRIRPQNKIIFSLINQTIVIIIIVVLNKRIQISFNNFNLPKNLLDPTLIFKPLNQFKKVN